MIAIILGYQNKHPPSDEETLTIDGLALPCFKVNLPVISMKSPMR